MAATGALDRRAVFHLEAPRRPRENRDAAFEKMAAAGDDELLVSDEPSNEWDDAEWEW